MSEAAPLWICFLPQAVSVAGDSFGQRCSRVYHKGNRRRFLLALVGVSCIQMLVVLGIIQLAMPQATTIIYTKVNGTSVDFCSMPEHLNDDRCFPQGPLTIYKALDLCPMLLLNGMLNILYYLGEASMYRQSLGVLMLVLAALSSSFIIAPLQNWLDISGAEQVSVWAILLGTFGALCCLIERTPKEGSPAVGEEAEEQHTNGRGYDSVTSLQSLPQGKKGSGPLSKDHEEQEPILSHNNNHNSNPVQPDATPSTPATLSQRISHILKAVLKLLPLLGPFVLLSFAYALYFVIMLYYNDHCKINMWGYNGFDQVSLPLYVYSFFLIVDFIKPCKKLFDDDNEPTEEGDADGEGERVPQESFKEAVQHAAVELFANKGAGFWHMFTYRLLINSRAVAYTYITVMYNLSSSYLELTLIRVVLSWVASLLLVLFVPQFIEAEVMEQRKLKDPLNLVLKIVGTGAIVGSLLIIHYA